MQLSCFIKRVENNCLNGGQITLKVASMYQFLAADRSCGIHIHTHSHTHLTILIDILYMCFVGISRQKYGQYLKDGSKIDWQCNKCCQQQMPSPHRDVSVFEPQFIGTWLLEDFIPPAFFCSDIKIDGECYIIFATDKMPQLLSAGKNWYTDATFKVI